MEAVFIIPLFLIIALVIRLLAGGMDHDRIRDYIEQRGGTPIDQNWSPFGPGWFGSRDERIYSVRYRDPAGNVHEAHCKTSLLSGVYFTRDEVVAYVRPPQSEPLTSAALEEENRRLKQELEQLQRDRETS